MIEVRGLSKRFSPVQGLRGMVGGLFRAAPQASVTALDEVSFSVGKGEVFGLVGPNGAGKTTLIKVLATLVLPDSGDAAVAGHDILADPCRVKASMGLVTGDERSFYWRLTGWQNLEFFGAFQGLPVGRVRERVRGLGPLLDGDALDRRVAEYSAGMRQRLGLLRALLHDPEVLLLDEPTKSIDPAGAAMVGRFVRDELAGRQGKSVLFATHNMAEAEAVCGRVGLLVQGRLVAQGAPHDIRERPELLSHG
ncbi:MAG: ABC transporter ATP-binding protein [Elusimicrobia bacterium]|nr:ABC transporter ATP-binding protein [Elusimicrobiota bacterium]